MKKPLLVLFAALMVAFGLTSMTSNNAEYSAGKAGSNGSPGEGTCASGSCHSNFALNSGIGSVSISVVGLVNGNLYVPGETYQVSVTVQQQGIGLFGFGLESLQASGANAGSWTPGADSHILNATISGNSRATIAHIDNSGFSSNARTWSFSWTAPSTEIPVTMYAAGNAANANGGVGGDYIYTSALSLMPVPPVQAPVVEYSGELLVCQGQSVSLSVNAQEGLIYTWQNSQGTQLGVGAIFNASQSECYSVTASDALSSATSSAVCVQIEQVNASFSGLAPMYCLGDAPVTLVPVVSGGTFSGQGIVGETFSPSEVPVGDFTIGYTLISDAGCEYSFIQSVSIREFSPANFVDLNSTYCTTDDLVDLNPVSLGGVFTGPVLLNSFDPNISPGLYNITYTTGVDVCSASETQTVEVLASLSSEFILSPAFCASSLAEQMVPDVAGGVFSGTSVNGDTFNPAQAIIGDNEVTYTLAQANGCVSTTTQVIAVFDVANSEFSGLEAITCISEGLVELLPVSPGGVFSGPGVSGTFFDPAVSGIGEHTILYDINLGDCQSETSIATTVLLGPDASFTGLFDAYCEDADIVSELICVNTPADFSGPGVSGNEFNAQSAGVGEHTVTCSYTDAFGCSGTSTQSVIVNPLPEVDITVAGDLMSATVAQEGATYQWWNCDTQLQVDGATSAEFSINDPSQNGSYSVAVTLNGCDAMSDCVLLLIESVDEVSGEWSSGFFPNPATTELNVWSTMPVGLDIYNSVGTLVLSRPTNSTTHSMDVSALPAGIYRVVMQHARQLSAGNLLIRR